MKILAVDYGDSRTGLATCDRTEFLTTAITPQITLKARDKVASKVCEVAKDIGAELIVIGLPLNMDGTEGERARKSRKLARPDVGRAPDHLRRRRPPRRERHLRHKAEGHPRLGERDGHSGRLPRMAEGASGGGLKAPPPPLRQSFFAKSGQFVAKSAENRRFPVCFHNFPASNLYSFPA